jgi:hypothetical protein
MTPVRSRPHRIDQQPSVISEPVSTVFVRGGRDQQTHVVDDLRSFAALGEP